MPKVNEAPRSKLRGIKAELRRSLTRLRSNELRRGSPCLSSPQSRWKRDRVFRRRRIKKMERCASDSVTLVTSNF